MVLDPQLDHGVPVVAGPRHDQDRRRLPPPGVASRGLCRVQRRQQPIGQRPRRALVERGQHRRPNAIGDHDVGLAGDGLALGVAGVRHARIAGVGRDAAGGVDHRHLARRAAGVLREQRLERLGALAPPSISSSPRGPYEISALAWVATAPTPGRAQGTIGPTENQCDCTATPSSPVAGSRATIE